MSAARTVRTRRAPNRVPTVAVAGRANVGKSSLVNRIVGRRIAVVESEPGVTRDRNVVDAQWNGLSFRLVDTGGWLASPAGLDAKISQQAERAIEEADLVLLVIDVTVGVTDEDLAAARLVRRSGTPVLAVVNKVDDQSREPAAWEALVLGAGDPWPVSAVHGRGTGDLLDEVVSRLRTLGTEKAGADRHAPADQDGGTEQHSTTELSGEADEAIGERFEATLDLEEYQTPEDHERRGAPGIPRVALAGRPNVGKSTLFNRLIGEDRAIVHDVPGTTRDAIDTVVELPEGAVCFVDTAGMRRPSRTKRGVEQRSVWQTFDALEDSDVAILVIDATVGATHQDQRLAERISAAGCAAVVLLNKWDLVATGDRDDVMVDVADRLAFLAEAPVLRVSAKTGRGMQKVVPALRASVEAYHHRVPTGALNRVLRDLQAHHPAPGARIRYGVQGAVDPPTFTLFASGRLPQTYLRYIERGLRERLDLGPTSLKLRVRTAGR